MAAYDYLLAGKIHHNRFTREDNLKSIQLLERAIELDPGYATAYAWKACVLGKRWDADSDQTRASFFVNRSKRWRRQFRSTQMMLSVTAFFARSTWCVSIGRMLSSTTIAQYP